MKKSNFCVHFLASANHIPSVTSYTVNVDLKLYELWRILPLHGATNFQHPSCSLIRGCSGWNQAHPRFRPDSLSSAILPSLPRVACCRCYWVDRSRGFRGPLSSRTKNLQCRTLYRETYEKWPPVVHPPLGGRLQVEHDTQVITWVVPPSESLLLSVLRVLETSLLRGQKPFEGLVREESCGLDRGTLEQNQRTGGCLKKPMRLSSKSCEVLFFRRNLSDSWPWLHWHEDFLLARMQ